MNTPGTSEGNWRWRCAARFLTDEAAAWLQEETIFYNRTGNTDRES
jgi:4-alpha-glucanotransferase